MAKETRNFQTEVNQILDIMINSLYSKREIFLRELISNASDALDKRRFAETTQTELAEGDKHIRLIPDAEAKTLTIMDNGIGMTRDEVVQFIGTIAYSGTKSFLSKVEELKERPELIGQFGVGFYSSFIVASKVQVHTQKAGTEEGTVWESTGDGSYTLDDTPRPEGPGTTIVLSLRTFDEDDDPQDFTDEWTVRGLVRKYSDFIAYPVRMKVTRKDPELDKDGKPIEGKFQEKVEDATLNSQKALWARSPQELKKEDYTEFYKHLGHDWADPQEWIHYRAEGTQEFTALVYLPANVPFDYNQRDSKFGLSLYVKRVFITDDCEQLLPQYLRFLKGLVDSSDLPLNISRELIQKDRHILAIRKAVVGKLLRHFKTMLSKRRDEYEAFWGRFGSTIKEGIPTDASNKEALTELVLFPSSASDKLTTLAEYVERMPEGQQHIYYITGESKDQLITSPYLEKLRSKGYEVLYLTDVVDEWVAGALDEFKGKKLISVTSEDCEVDSEEEKKAQEDKLKDSEEKFKNLSTAIQMALAGQVKEVKVSSRLVDSPVCLVSAANDPSAHMQRVMEKLGQDVPETQRILEINPDHPVLTKMLGLEKEQQGQWAEILYNQALLNEGSPIKDPAKFSARISELMLS